MLKEELDKKRIYVIRKFINIESIINIIISSHYFKDKDGRGIVRGDFLFQVLNDEYFQSILRINILKKIVEDFDDKILSKLKALATIRNYLVHIDPNYFETDQKVNEETINLVGYYPHPKNPKEKIDFEKEYNNFLELEKEVGKYLVDICKKYNLEFFKD